MTSLNPPILKTGQGPIPKIINLTKNKILAEDVILSTSFLKRLTGLLGYKSLEKNQAMILWPANSVHTFFMRFPIDVLFVDRNNIVIKTVSNMVPFRATAVYFKSLVVIELPSGMISITQTAEGDYLQM
jgi:uncharacterized membrane protein (UPF0127 family)